MTPNEQALMRKLIEVTTADYLAETSLEKANHYSNRTTFVCEAMALAHRCGYAVGIRLDAEEDEWPVAFIELPTGQISYHMPQHPLHWDYHTTEEKRQRVAAYVTRLDSET